MAAEADELTSVDHSFEDETYTESTSASGISYVTSIASYIREGIEENGRKYPAYGRNAYGLPVDEREQERNDLQHAKFKLIVGDRLHAAPIEDSPSRILDLGTGSGIWAIEAADKYESAQVTGVDIAPVQPLWVPPNCQFEILDIEDDWLFAANSFDLIHARELIIAIRDWDRLFEQGFQHLNTGGYFEAGGMYLDPASDDNTIPKDSYIQRCGEILSHIGEAMGTTTEAPRLWKGKMEKQGFVEVREEIFKIPLGVWPKDRRLKKVGAYENYNLTTGLDAYLMRGYTQILGGDLEELQVLVAEARRELRDPKMHAYVWYYNVYGRKPGLPHS